MTPNPQLPNHLIRELVNTIRLKESGDAMVRLALSGKEPFSVFRYVVENHVFVDTDEDGVFLASRQGRQEYDLNFLTKGSNRLVIRFVRELRAENAPPSEPMPLENIIELSVHEYNKSFDTILKSSINLEVLTVDFFPNFDDFFDEVTNGNISLTNLRKLDISLDFDELFRIMSTTSVFPLPEDVTLRCDCIIRLPNLVSLKTFPKVKHLVLGFRQLIKMTTSMLPHVSTVANCFTGLETAKIVFHTTSYLAKNEFVEIVEFHRSLRNTHFSFPVEVDYDERVSLVHPGGPKQLYEQLKSIGFKEESVGFNKYRNGDAFFVLKKEFGNVKLNHYITHIEAYMLD